MRMLKRGAVGLGMLVLAGAPGAAMGQTKRIELGGFAGVYVPTSEAGLQNATRDASRLGSLDWGGRVTYWTSRSVAVELTGGYSTARITVQSTLGRLPRSTDLWMGSGKVMLNLLPGSSKLGIVIGAGAAALHAQKSVSNPAGADTNIGGVGAVGLRLPFFGAIVRGDLENYVYGGDFGRGSKLTNDLVLSGGLSIRM